MAAVALMPRACCDTALGEAASLETQNLSDLPHG
jgi:hypothetical protein